KEFPDVFGNQLVLCTKAEAQLSVFPDVKPVFRPKRPVPFSVVAVLDPELEHVQHMDVISPVSYSLWVTSLVVVKKVDDLFARLNGCIVFSIIDFLDVYLKVEVAEKSRPLLAVNTQRGLFQYNRLPFGVKCAQAIFQQMMYTILADLPFSMAFIDDIIVASKNEKVHYAHLQK
ncbi:hypothetical protein EWB00_005576, partial [Schistosoma japonicum]